MSGASAFHLLQNEQRPPLLFGCPIIDGSIGGIPTRGITEISGEAGAGKTQTCLHLIVRALLQPLTEEEIRVLPTEEVPVPEGTVHSNPDGPQCCGAAILSCGEGTFPVKRLSQLAANFATGPGKPSLQRLLSNVHIEQCRNADDAVDALFNILPEMCRTKRIRILVMDSIAGLVRTEYDARQASEARARTGLLFRIARQLKWLSDTFRIAIVVVNQVTAPSAQENSSLEKVFGGYDAGPSPALGMAWAACVNTSLVVSRFHGRVLVNSLPESNQQSVSNGEETTLRRLTLVTSPSRPESSVKFIIRHQGLMGVS